MTPHGIVERATLGDVEELFPRLRAPDLRELVDMAGGNPLETLKRGVLMGKPSYALRTLDRELVALLTVVPYGDLGGVISLSGTAAIEDNRTAFLRGSLDVLAHLDTRFDTLFNVCDARNEVHVRWLRWMGFSLIRRIERYGAAQVPVFEFARIRNV